MANLFERPIAAQPLSEFVELPLQFIDNALERRQQRYDQGMAAMQAFEDEFLKLGYLPGDADRHLELRQGYETRLDAIADAVGDDYSRVLPQLNRITRDLKQDMSYGELGAQNRAYLQAMEFKKQVDKAAIEGKISQEGHNLAMLSMQNHVTTPTSAGNYTPFNGYRPSTVVDPIKALQDGVDEIVAKYNADGMKYVDRKLISQNIRTKIETNTNLKKALEERLLNAYGQNTTPELYKQYIDGIVESVITDKRFQEKPTLKDASGNVRTGGGMISTMFDVQQPDRIQGAFSYSGANAPWARNVFKAMGFDAWGDFTNSINTPEAQRRIKYLEKKYGEKFPTTPYEQSIWLNEKMNENRVGEIQVRRATNNEMRLIDAQGFFTTDVAVYNRKGELLDADEIEAIQGGTKSGSDTRVGNRVAQVTQAVQAGSMYPPGTLVIRGSDGEEYFVENRSPDLINSPQYNASLIDMASYTNSGLMDSVTLRSAVGEIPPGTYQVEHVSGNNYNLYENGTLKYRKFTDKNGVVYGRSVVEDDQ